MSLTSFPTFVTILIGISKTVASHNNFFRRDYVYIEEFDAFYKPHFNGISITYDLAFEICNDEGAQLYYPKRNNEWMIVKNLTNTTPLPSNETNEIMVGIRDQFINNDYLTVDGLPTPSPIKIVDDEIKECVWMNIENGEMRAGPCQLLNENEKGIEKQVPFVCKKVPAAKPCPTVDEGYKYSEGENICYKVNLMPQTWYEAFHTCFMEGGLLAVYKTKAQYVAISAILTEFDDDQYFAGMYRPIVGGPFYTLTGERFSSLGTNGDGQDCQIINKERGSLYMSTTKCSEKLPFICQMEPNDTFRK